jgi:hypothetical protein
VSGGGEGSAIVGVWRLAKTSAVGDDGAAMHPPYGEDPRGLLVFYADGRMMSVLCDSRKQLPPGEDVREYMSYCGNYTWDGRTLVTRVDASAEAKRVGGEQTRFTAFEDGLLVLTQKPRPWQGKMQHRALYWEKVAEA